VGCSAVAVLRFRIGPGGDPPGPGGASAPGGARAPGGVGAPGGAPPTTICSPSTSRRARLIGPGSAPFRTPPAASIASATREPAARVSTPGRRTLPVTWTTTRAVGVGEPAASVAAGPPEATGTGGGIGSATGLDRQTKTAVISAASTPAAIN